MSDVRLVCIIAAPRTGSSHTTSLLRNCPEINVKGQLFRSKVSSRDWEAFRTASNGEVTDSDSLRNWRLEHPAETLQIFYESGGGKPLVFKLFRKDLSPEQIKETILARKDARFMILRRRPIESFISWRKAAMAGAHKKVDTTAIAPTLEASQFVNWAEKTKGWYEWVEKALKEEGRDCIEIAYETHLDPLSNSDALSGLLDLLSSLGLPRLPLPAVDKAGRRQDREPDYRKRVANWDEFEADLLGREDGAELLAWAQKAPA